jgi:uncharacterized membrane protein
MPARSTVDPKAGEDQRVLLCLTTTIIIIIITIIIILAAALPCFLPTGLPVLAVAGIHARSPSGRPLLVPQLPRR